MHLAAGQEIHAIYNEDTHTYILARFNCKILLIISIFFQFNAVKNVNERNYTKSYTIDGNKLKRLQHRLMSWEEKKRTVNTN